MPGITTPSMNLVLPSLGGDSGSWDDLTQAIHLLIDAHRHIPGEGNKVPVAGISIDADMSFGSTWGLTNLNRTSYASVAAPSTNKSVFVSDGTGGLVSGELYWRTAAGSNVRITNGASLNVSAFVGGVGGDYSSVGAEIAYDNSNLRYTFEQASSTNWARLASGSHDIYETSTTESVRVRLSAPAALGASYEITFPTAAPGSTSVVQMSSAGVLSASNTLPTLGATTVASLVVTGAASVGSTLTGAASLLMTSAISPSALASGSTHNYAPTGFADAFWVRLSPNAAGSTLTGLAGGAAGRIVLLTNTQGGAGVIDITLTNEDAGSTAGNRFTGPGAGSVVINAGESLLLIYDGTTSRWRPITL